MPALDSDIGAAIREAVVVTWASDAIAQRYPSARDGSTTPATGYCDSAADAQTLTDERGALIGVERRRFAVSASGLTWPDVATAVPCAVLRDAEQSVDGRYLSSRIELDLEAETTTLELFG